MRVDDLYLLAEDEDDVVAACCVDDSCWVDCPRVIRNHALQVLRDLDTRRPGWRAALEVE